MYVFVCHRGTLHYKHEIRITPLLVSWSVRHDWVWIMMSSKSVSFLIPWRFERNGATSFPGSLFSASLSVFQRIQRHSRPPRPLAKKDSQQYFIHRSSVASWTWMIEHYIARPERHRKCSTTGMRTLLTAILGADQKERGLWGRECRWNDWVASLRNTTTTAKRKSQICIFDCEKQ